MSTQQSSPTLICLSCGDTMTLTKTIPQLGVRPQQLLFVCPSCNGVQIKSQKRAA